LAEWKTYPEDKKRQVFQQLLAKRFKLQIHTETHEGQIYELVIAQGGPKIKSVEPAPNSGNGFIEQHSSSVVICDRISMASFVSYLSRLGMGRELHDKTGLTGNYNFTLQFAPMQPSSSFGGDESSTPPQDVGAPSIFTALQGQLGLKLVPTKGPVVSYVIDHVEKPSED